MNLGSLQFSIAVVGVSLLFLLALDVATRAPSVVYAAFAPALVWAFILTLRERR